MLFIINHLYEVLLLLKKKKRWGESKENWNMNPLKWIEAPSPLALISVQPQTRKEWSKSDKMGKKNKKAGKGKEKTERKTAKAEEKRSRRETKKLSPEDDIDAILVTSN